jgi:DNA-binding MarR family transcriptional regulator
MTDGTRGRLRSMKLTQYFPYIISRVAGESGALRSKVLEDFDLSTRAWRALVALGERDGQRVTDLSSVSLTEISTLSRLLDDMEDQGLVEKRRARPNARSVTVHITDAGRKVLKETIPEALRYQETLLEGIDDEELAITRRVLNQIYGNALLHKW